jgi:hypothetical protein
MKTTVEVSDDLYRRAKAEAALRGRKLKDLVEEGLRLVLGCAPPSLRRVAGRFSRPGGTASLLGRRADRGAGHTPLLVCEPVLAEAMMHCSGFSKMVRS